jgi:hypothetical protein
VCVCVCVCAPFSINAFSASQRAHEHRAPPAYDTAHGRFESANEVVVIQVLALAVSALE